MDEPLTEELLDELLSSSSAQSFVDEHQLGVRSLSDYLQELVQARGLERKDVVREAQLDATYGYQLFTGGRAHPARDKVLALAFALHLDLRETDRLLQAAGVSRLYVKDRRDAIVVFCLDRRASLSETNDALYAMGESTLT